MASIPYTITVRDSAVATGDNRKTGLTPNWVFLKTLASNADIASPPSITEVAQGQYKFSFDAEASGEAAGQIDVGSGLTNPSDRYIDVVLTRDSSRIQSGIDGNGKTALATTQAFNNTGQAANIPAQVKGIDDAVGEALAVKVDEHLLDQTDGVAVANAIAAAVGNVNVDVPVLIGAIRSDMERTGGILANLFLDYMRRQDIPSDYAKEASLTALGTPQQAGNAVTLPYAVATPQNVADSESAVLQAIPPAESIANTLLDLVDGIEDDMTLRQSIRILLAPIVGIETDNAFRDTNNTINRVSYTLDGNGKRSGVTLNKN